MPNTSRLNLNLPEGTDLADAPVAASISDQMTIIDTAMDGQVVDPLPAGFSGKIVFYSAAGLVMIKKPTGDLSWTYLGAAAKPWGRRGYVRTNTAGPAVAPGNEVGPYMQISTGLYPGRKYNIIWAVNVATVDSGSWEVNPILNRINIRVAAGASVTSSSLNISALFADNAVRYTTGDPTIGTRHQGFTTYAPESITPNTMYTFGIFLERLAQGGSPVTSLRIGKANNDNFLAVEDVGINA